MKTLSNDQPSFVAMLAAVQKVRSVAAEGDYLDLLPSWDGIRGLAPLTGTDRAVEVLSELASGERTVDEVGFRNLCRAFELEGVGIVLATQGYLIPELV